jgi:ribosome-interacting GTPase 1
MGRIGVIFGVKEAGDGRALFAGYPKIAGSEVMCQLKRKLYVRDQAVPGVENDFEL